MAGSPPFSRLLSHDALVGALMVFDVIVTADAAAHEGSEVDARECLAAAALSCASWAPVIRGVIAAQEQAAQALHLAQGPRAELICGAFRVTEPKPDAANAHASPPQQPDPIVA